MSVQVEIRSAEAPGHAYYRGTVDLARELPEPPLHRPRLADELGPFPMTVEEAYRRWLFHGPVLQGITDIHGISGQGVVATCRSSSPGECLSGDPPGQWLIDPVVCDSGLQLILLWARARHDLTALPSHLREYRRFRPLTGPSIRCFMDARVMPDGHVIRAHLAFVSEDGRVAGVLEDLECTGSKALNRLAGGHRRL